MFLMTIVSLVAAITEAFHSKWSSRLGQVPVIALFLKKIVLIIYFLLLAADAIDGFTPAGLLHKSHKISSGLHI